MRRPHSRTRLGATGLVCLLLGMGVTVAVAWACTLWMPVGNPVNLRMPGADPGGVPPTPSFQVPGQAAFLSEDLPLLGAVPANDSPVIEIGIAMIAPGLDARWMSRSVISADMMTDPSAVREAWVVRSGWPLKAIKAVGRPPPRTQASQKPAWASALIAPAWLGPRSAGPLGVAVPLSWRPTALGFAADTGLYAAAGFGAWMALSGFRRLIRRRSGRCPACGYDRAGLTGGAPCPECGPNWPRS